MAINGWLGPAWIKTGWYQAERLLAGAVVEDEIRRRNDELSRRLKEGDYRDAAERLNLERGQTIVMVTHDPAIADHAARQITVRDGQVESDTSLTPDGLLTMADSEVLNM